MCSIRFSDAESPNRVELASLKTCVDAAGEVVAWILDCDMSERGGLRYCSDSSWLMIALSCLFILRCLDRLQALGCAVARLVVNSCATFRRVTCKYLARTVI